jgi:hypothetical protein
LEQDLLEQVKEADRDQEEDEATAREWAEAEQPLVLEVNASASHAEPQLSTRQAPPVIR